LSVSGGNERKKTYDSLLNRAARWKYLSNQETSQEKFKEPPQRERYLSKDELPRFLSALDEEEDGFSVAAIRLLLFTGCRRGEVMSLKWNEVRLDEDCISLLDSKNGRSRMVHLNAWANRRKGNYPADFVADW
jgi:integrase